MSQDLIVIPYNIKSHSICLVGYLKKLDKEIQLK